MLHSHNESSDSETGYLTPITPLHSISNPSYGIPTIESGNQSKTNREPLKTPDNYITMPQYKNLINSSIKNGGVEPSVELDLIKDRSSAHYVNEDADMWNSVNVW